VSKLSKLSSMKMSSSCLFALIERLVCDSCLELEEASLVEVFEDDLLTIDAAGLLMSDRNCLFL